MSGPDDKTHEDTLLREALSVFDDLEAARRRGGASPIEACLAKMTIEDRPAMLCFLVTLDLAARRGHGERPLESEYLQRFPDQVQIIRAAFSRSVPDGESTRISGDTVPSEGSARPLMSSSPHHGDDLPRTEMNDNHKESDSPTLTHRSDFLMNSGVQPMERSARYSLTRFHKGGGHGEVWRARDHQLGREVALKRLKDVYIKHSAIRARFMREAWITGQLQHPGIVPVFELGNLPDVDGPFYAMRFIEGPTFSAAAAEFHLKRHQGTTGPLDLRKLLGSFMSACQVVAYAHSRGVIHRDLKGQNIVLGDFGEVIVLDWGIAKVVGGALAKPGQETCEPPPTAVEPPDGVWDDTLKGSIWGTPAYMPPEQALGRIDEIDQRSDVYGMGAILYEVLTGEPPFMGSTTELLQKVVTDPPVPPRQKVHDAPEALEAICLKCLAKSPDDRYPSAVALAEDIQRFLAGEPVSVHRETWKVTARRWAWRHRTFVTATLATLLVATGCLAVATVLLRISNHREALARAEAEKNLSLTLRAVDSFFTRVADAPSLKTFGLEKFQKDVLTEAETVIKQLHDVQARASDVSADHGHCCLRLSQVTGMLGDPESAIPYAMEARSIFTKLSESDPGRRAEHQRGLAESLDALGLADEGVYRLDEAEAAHEQAAHVWESLAAERQSPPEIAYHLVASLNRRGRLLCLRLGDPGGARQILARSLDHCDRLVREHPASADYARERAKAMVLTGVAMTSGPIKDVDGATALFERALPQFEKLAENQPANTEVQADLVDACALIAASYSNSRLEGRIMKIYEQVRNNAKRLVREHPDVPNFAENNALIESLHSMRIALMGNHRLAVELLNGALKGAGKSGLARMFAACCFSVASEVASRDPALAKPNRDVLVERYQTRAVELLREAKETGLFFQPHQLEGVRSKDDDLKPLRERTDFREFLSELEKELASVSVSRPGRPRSMDRPSPPK